jgi:hypothetical protein
MDIAWSILKQYEPMRPLHRRSVIFPQMRSPTKWATKNRVMHRLYDKPRLGRYSDFNRLRYDGRNPERYGQYLPIRAEDDQPGPLHEVRFQHQRKGRNLTADERAIRNLEDRNQAIDRANQFHQDRIDAMQNLPEPRGFSRPPNPDFNPFTMSGGQ